MTPRQPTLVMPALVIAAVLLVVTAGCTSDPTTTAVTAVPAGSPTLPAVVPPAGSVPGVSLAPELAPTAGSAVGSPERTAPTSGAGQGIGVGVDRSDPDAVTEAVLTTVFTSDTTADQGPNDAAARAVGLLTPQFSAAVVGTPPVRGPGAQWLDWAARGVRLTPTLQALPDDRPDDTATAAYRIYLVTQTPITSDGQDLAPVVVVAYVQLLTTTSGWAVANIDQR